MLHVRDPKLPSAVPRYGVVVLFRLVWCDEVAAVLDAARAAGVPVLFDIDDLAFDPSLDGLMPFRKRYSPSEWAASYGRQMSGLRKTMLAADAFIGSTAELAEHAARLGKPAHVHPNVVPDRYLRAGAWLRRFPTGLRRQPTIGYFSGSDTHDEDFSSIAGALARVLRDDSRARVVVCGHLQVSGLSFQIERRLVRLPYMDWRDFAFAYAMCHVTLAPLSVKNAFTDAKSALKFFEAGAFHTPTIASPVREMASAIRHGETGWLAETEDQWADLVARALEPETSARVGEAARRAVESNHSSASVQGRLGALLAHYAITPAGPEPELLPIDPPDETGEKGPIRALFRPFGAAVNAARIFSTSRRGSERAFDVQRLDRWIESVSDGEAAGADARRAGATLVAFGDFSAWHENEHVTGGGELPGERRSIGTDPQMTSPVLGVHAEPYRYVVVRMRALTSSGTTRAQVYWSDGSGPFVEAASTSVAVRADGVDATYVFDLSEAGSFRTSRSRRVTRLRIDPLDTAGSFRLVAVILLPAEPNLGNLEAPTAPENRPSRIGDAAAQVAALPPGGVLRAFVPGAGPLARRELAAALAREGEMVEVRRLSPSAGGVVAELVRRFATSAPGVDIVVPIFNALELVRRCVRSVLEHVRGDYRLVLVDDASTDPDLARYLSRVAADSPRVVLLRNSENLGFLGSANRGLRNAGGRDVLLLNSDTEVFEGFLEALVECAYSQDGIGLVSPLSNNATILSVPDFCRKNDLPAGVDAKDVAAVVRAASRRQRPEIVTPHGFCLYVKAAVIAEVGVFDGELFGRGFGEENDLGERAKLAGWKVVAADDVYVWHDGKGSFGDEGLALENEHAAVLDRRHPTYFPDVAEFVRRNPLSAVQSVVRRNLLRRAHALRPAPLVVLHEEPFGEHPGGVEYCVRDLVKAMALPRVVFFYPTADAVEVLEIIDGDLDRRLSHRFPLGRPPERFCRTHEETERIFTEVLTLFHIGWVHVHHLMFLPMTLPRIASARGLPYLVTVHDFYWACPSFNLLDTRTNTRCCPDSCGDRARTAACQRALFRTLGDPLPDDPAAFVDRHRTVAREILAGAHTVVFPSKSAERLVRSILRLELARAQIVPHGYDAARASRKARAPGDPLRVGIVGQVAYASKGADAYLSVIERSASDGIEWHFFGNTKLFEFESRLAARAPNARVVYHGAYDRESIVPSLAAAGIDVGLLLPAWPETFSYTLSELAGAGVPVVAARIGALADRLRDEPWARLVDGPAEAVRALAALFDDPLLLERMTRSVRAPEGTLPWARAHAEMYRACASASPVEGPKATSAAEHARLNEVAVATVEPVLAPSVTEPSPSVASTRWYRYAQRFKPYVPESVRHYARRRLASDGVRDVVRFRLPGPHARIGDGLSLRRRYLSTAAFTSHANDPYLLLFPEPFDPRKVDEVRFNLWCSTPRSAFAQLYWRHAGSAAFDEENSLVIPLNGKVDAWQEYIGRFDGTRPCRAWYEGGSVVELRFDPINLPGPIGLGELVLSSRRPP